MTRDRRFLSATPLLMLCVAAAALASTASRAASTVVYRCLDTHLGVVYTDLPCKEGAPFDIRTGEVDTVAVAKLERFRDALDASAAQRMVDERRLAGQKELLAAQLQRGAGDGYNGEETLGDGAYAYPVAGYAPFRSHPPRHPASRRPPSLGGAPSPPYVVPRPRL
ncbi:MAG: hypothetical protein E6H53_07275 [Betaproteobacteria bacterium]|nr:MAG: hypothetical protein E6H53_07275 [Betaproteobacteria bacterium]